jgi:hypothetical protein
LRSRQNQEVPLVSYQAFQKDGKMQQAVARQLTRQCSSRDYALNVRASAGIGKPRRLKSWKA